MSNTSNNASMRISLFEPFVEIDLDLPDRRDGKVRSSWSCGDQQRLIVTTDRLSAFDRVLAGVPYKGQVLNELAAWWFEQTADIIANHVMSVPDPNALVAREAVPLTVEVVVRGYITGVTDTSIWGMYQDGARTMYGYDFPDGLQKNTQLPAPIVTPTTKAQQGGHDEPLSSSEVVERGLVDRDLWGRVVDAALAVFQRGVAVGADAGLILADTKYEFGVTADDELILIDEMHTPDSSRWWMADSYFGRLTAGDEPESLDKEVVRRAFADIGYRGDGPIPALPPEVWSATTARYIVAYERLTGTPFSPGSYPVADRLTANLTKAGLL
ncbi:MAG TPA: phosphoribosylaminoimidazolesuccinocarboxamide synthase [Ilumatobacter sp.]|nr:phosphoribosylaminoimidazolesuccinocarboxamide synthase [Ilumatobacter sp.]